MLLQKCRNNLQHFAFCIACWSPHKKRKELLRSSSNQKLDYQIICTITLHQIIEIGILRRVPQEYIELS